MITPKEVSEKVFDKTFGVGYRIDDVNSYLSHVAGEIKNLLDINADLEKKIEVLADKLTEYREDEESLRTAILGAQKLGDSVIRESKTKAEIITRDATCKAEAMVNNARRQIEREQENLIRTQREVAGFKNRLLDMYKSHIELISAIPGDIEEEDAAALPEQKTEEQQPDIVEENTDFMPDYREETESDDSEQIEIVPAEEAQKEKKLSPEEFFGLNDESDDENEKEISAVEEDDDDEDDDVEEEPAAPSRFSDIDMKFGDAFRLKHNGKPKFRK